jgi:hypothetical protein
VEDSNQDPIEITFGVIRSCCSCNSNPTVGSFIDAMKTNIVNGLAFRDLCVTNCEDDGDALLDNLQSLLRAPESALRNPSSSHGKET